MKTKLFIILAASILLASCSTLGVASGTNRQITQTTVNLSSNNYRIIGECSGEVSYVYIFGLGGPRNAVAVSNAADAMYKNANLSGSQAIINVREYQEVKSIVGALYIKKTIRVSGEIIEFK